MYKIAWFSTGRDKAAHDLLKVVQQSIITSSLPAEISFVFSNREPDESHESNLFFNLVREYNIPLFTLSSSRFKPELREAHPTFHSAYARWRITYDREVMNLLRGLEVNLCVMAGYMLIIGEEMCYEYDIINLHPALPNGPAGTWQEVIWKLIEARATQSGVMMHLVTPELDKGPPITYCTYPIRGEPFDKHWKDTEGRIPLSPPLEKGDLGGLAEIKREAGEEYPLFKLIRQHGLKREFPLIVSTLKSFSKGEIRIHNRRVINAMGEPIKGYDLTDEIEKAIVSPTS